MPPKANTAPGYERFEPREAGLAIQLSDEARESMLSDVMTGFGAVPRRGAEVGGILLGRRDGDTIWVDDVAPVRCEHRRGPSFLLSDQDRQNLEDLVLELRTTGRERYPVGMFRSNTRDREGLSDEDRELFAALFPPPDGLFMLVRPFATKPSTVSFLVYRGASLPDSSEKFPLARVPGSAGVRRRPLGEPAPHRTGADDSTDRPANGEPWTGAIATIPPPQVPAAAEPAGEVPNHTASYPASGTGAHRRAWMLVPLSFIFLLLGVLLGFQSALTLYPKPKAADASALTAGLTAVRKGENLHIRWNREALAITSAQGGTLEIEDGANRKSVELDASALQNGSVIYPPASDHVTLRFDITVRSGTRLIETLSWSKKPE